MRKMMMFVMALCMVLTAPASWAMDVYDWRAKTEWICAQSFTMLERQILANMVGGRPENLVVEKLKDAVPVVQNLGEIDTAAAQIVIKSLVHSFFTDEELRLPIYTIRSVQKARMSCSADVVRYDSDGSKAEAYKSVRAEEQWKKNEREKVKAKKRAQKRTEEERAQIEEQIKQEEEAKTRAAEEARIRQEEENARQEEQRRLKAEEEARQHQELEKNRAEVAERQKQHDAAIKDMLKNTRTDENIAREEAEQKQKEEEARKANSGLGGFIKSLW
jgi:hypothetical protein